MSRECEGRHIVKRIIVCGVLVLDTPTCLGNGDAEGPTDLMLLRDSISAKALLTGSSIAGALRNYLHEYKRDYGKSERRQDIAAKLFGDLFAYDDEKHLPEQQKLDTKKQDTQSPLIIDDALSRDSPRIELRDGVKIDSATGTAADQAKYDLELLSAGTQFPLNFELLIDRENDENQLREALALALEGLKSGEISIGMKKRRGFGRCHVDEWQVWEFDLRQHRDRVAWLSLDRSWSKPYAKPPTTSQSIAAALGVTPTQPDRRDRFFLQATFKLASPLLIRSGQDSTGCAPDVVHLRSHRDGELKPVLSGTSLAGVLRHRAERIVNTLNKPEKIVNDLFGFVEKNSKQAKASRLVVHESVIENTADLVQNRIAIDRFTGGAYHGALFDEQPIFGSDKTIVTVELELRNPKDYEIGLLLLLLKDLWTSDLPVGGESSIGRGRLQGKDATLTWHKWDKEKKIQQKEEWTIVQAGENKPLEVSDYDRLEEFVQHLVNYPTEVVKVNE
ncbi:MAG: RAMP superfamily CRISPR-associated protein [Coleofasciculus sp. G3-WIS-01]|uniref:RAMP superfamily CRISPR-associated protein n=1 Tax=Coleofasciculus sp. G3-WIS-01 TaxID=3069528 RepID=UPI0032FEF9BF